MTECERIISEGIFPKNFLKEEMICDFWVDEKRKKIWMIELDLLIQFDKVCRRHNLTYYLMFGSLLGVIRHQGFIPWDDDLDVVMPREDYEKFLKLSNEFEEPYFLQTPYTDEGYFFSYAKLRNSRTTAISISFRFQPFNQGIPLDIFPLDCTIEESIEERFQTINNLILQNSGYMRMSLPNPTKKDLARIEMYHGRNPIDLYEEIQSIAQQFQCEQTKYKTVAVFTVYKHERLLFESKDFEETTMAEIAGYSFPIPKSYDSILKTIYGDYMKFPPIEDRGNWHNEAVFEPDIPYKIYIKENHHKD